jgi:lysozyme
MGMIDGIDVSDYQGPIDWEAVRNAGKGFAFIKATDGRSHVQKRFAENWAGALYAGLTRGAYHFFRAGSGAAQADHFLRIYPGAGELPAVLDLERADDTGEVPDVLEALLWIAIVERETGVRPMVYTSPSFAAEQRLGDHRELALSDLWVAHWHTPGRPPRAAPRVPRPWAEWRCWQTGKGHVAGIRGEVDLDVMWAW